MDKKEQEVPQIAKATIYIFIFIILAFALGVWAKSFLLGFIIIIIGFVLAIKSLIGNKESRDVCDATSAFEGDVIHDSTDYSKALTLHETEYICKIAGVQHHSYSNKVGGFIGYVMADHNNRYDKNAIGVYDDHSRLVGYIPREEQRDFREWSKRNPLPCIGFIAKEGGYIRSKVKVIDANPDLTELHIFKFTRWLILNHGIKFIPKAIVVEREEKPITEDEWLDFIDDCIRDKESTVKAMRRKSSTNQQEQ